MIELKRTNSTDQDFKLLVNSLDIDLSERNGALQDQYTQYNIINGIDTVVIAYYNSIPIGCGCYKKFNASSAEIKRMFVQKKYRGKGVSKKILHALEKMALENGFTSTILETGIHQYEAIGLYTSSGYGKIENYGQYKGMNDSLCMLKKLP